MGILDKLKGMMSGHEDQARKGVDKAGNMADDKTGGKYDSQIDSGTKQAEDRLGLGDEGGKGGHHRRS